MVVQRWTTAVIPAIRADGSAEASLRTLGQAPLIAYSLAAARQALSIEKTWVASDDPRVLELVKDYDVSILELQEVPSKDDSSVIQAVIDALTASGDGVSPLFAVLRPTNPIHPCGLVDKAVQTLSDHPEANRAVSAFQCGKAAQIFSGQINGLMQPLDNTVWVESGHVSVYRGIQRIAAPALIIPVDRGITPDLATPLGWNQAASQINLSQPEFVYPLRNPRPIPEKVVLLVMDFDGVLTDNRVWVDENGKEMVAAYRGDSLGLKYLEQCGIRPVVLSKETNPVVEARCRKMKVSFRQGIDDKPAALMRWLAELNIRPEEVIFLGNDINDTPCFPLVGCAVVPSDAEPAAIQAADLVLTRQGGHGAVRELCDLLLARSPSGQPESRLTGI